MRIFLKEVDRNIIKICELLHKASFDSLVEFSNRKLQDIKKPKVATCGYWCVLFIKSGLTVDDFYDFIDSFKVKDKDSLVVDLVLHGMPPTKRKRLI